MKRTSEADKRKVAKMLSAPNRPLHKIEHLRDPQPSPLQIKDRDDKKALDQAFDRRIDAEIAQAGEVTRMMVGAVSRKPARMAHPKRKKK